MTSEPVVRPRPRVRILALVVLVVYLVVCAYVLLTPNGDVPSSGVFELQQLGVRLGVPDPVIARTEQLANVALFVPVGLFFLLLVGTRFWWAAIGLGIAMTVAIETAQRSIPGRVSDERDLLTNTVGTLIGVLVGIVLTLPATLRRGRVRRRQLARQR